MVSSLHLVSLDYTRVIAASIPPAQTWICLKLMVSQLMDRGPSALGKTKAVEQDLAGAVVP